MLYKAGRKNWEEGCGLRHFSLSLHFTGFRDRFLRVTTPRYLYSVGAEVLKGWLEPDLGGSGWSQILFLAGWCQEEHLEIAR